MPNGPLIIVSGPSGCGKSTLVQRVLAEGGLPLRAAISATTRTARPGEVNDVAYHFWDTDHFLAEVAADAFLECCEVHGRYYGTPRSEVDPYRERGLGVILVIDVQGAAKVRAQYPDAVSIFVTAPSWEALEQRLRSRGTENDAALALRLANARKEMDRIGEYDQTLVNDDLETAVSDLRARLARLFTKGETCSTS
jgi:guanylate kinase